MQTEILGFLINLKDLILSLVSIFMTKICSEEETTLLDFNVNNSIMLFTYSLI